MDGCFKHNKGRGVLRDENDTWKGGGEGFKCHYQGRHVAKIEEWGRLQGLEWVWNKGIRKLEVRSDSMKVVHLSTRY